jgi:hypothetical protein
VMQKDKLAAMNIWRGGIAEMRQETMVCFAKR